MDGDERAAVRDGRAPDHVVLLGLMGAGKTSVGLQLARLMGRPFVDSDLLVELDRGRSPVDLEVDEGTSALHAAELDALRRVLGRRDPVVVAAAASVIDAAPADELAGAWVVWLDGPPEVLAARLAEDHPRPNLGEDAMSTLRDQRTSREPWARSHADLSVDVTRGTPEAIADRILDSWHERDVPSAADVRATDVRAKDV